MYVMTFKELTLILRLTNKDLIVSEYISTSIRQNDTILHLWLKVIVIVVVTETASPFGAKTATCVVP